MNENQNNPSNQKDQSNQVTVSFVTADVFAALSNAAATHEGHKGIDWPAAVSAAEWREHQERLRSVTDAQQEAELLGSDVLIG